MVPNLKELLDKLGIKMEIIKAGEFKATGNPFDELTEAERQLIDNIVQETYIQFKSDELEFRKDKISKQEFEKVADGRIFSGRQALKLKLVDELMPREQAIEKAARIAGISGKPSIKTYAKPPPTLFDLLSISGQAIGRGFKQSFSLDEEQNVQVRT